MWGNVIQLDLPPDWELSQQARIRISYISSIIDRIYVTFQAKNSGFRFQWCGLLMATINGQGWSMCINQKKKKDGACVLSFHHMAAFLFGVALLSPSILLTKLIFSFINLSLANSSSNKLFLTDKKKAK